MSGWPEGGGTPPTEHMTVAEAAKWEDPLPLGWHTDLPVFPVDALPPVLADYVKALSAEIQVPHGLAGPVVLGMLAAAVARWVRVRVRASWVEPTNLYVVPVAEPAARKSAVMAACRQPIDSAEADLRELLADQVADSRTKRDVLEQYAEKLKKKAAGTGKAEDVAEAQDAVRAALAVEVIAYPRLTTADATPEALVGLLAEQRGRIAAISAEAGAFDALIGRYTTRPNLDPILMAHAGDTITVDRRSRPPERVDHPALTIVMSTQPFALREMVSRPDFAGRGLLGRVLWSLPPDVAGTRTWEADAAPEPVKHAYRALVAGLAIAAGQANKTVTLTLDDRAYEVLGVHYLAVEAMLRRDGELGGADLLRFWGGKLVGATVRIAGCLHAVGGLDEIRVPITEATMRNAVSLADYFRAHAIAALGGGDDDRSPAARQLVGWLTQHKKTTFTTREIQRSGPRALRKIGALKPPIDYLAALGWLRDRTGEGGYELHPDVETLATAATTATGTPGSTAPAGRAVHHEDPAVSPLAATPGDVVATDAKASPPVATIGDTATDVLTSDNTVPVAVVAAVARVSDSGCPRCGFGWSSIGHAANCGGPDR